MLRGEYGEIAEALPIILIYTVLVVCGAAIAFGRKMKADLN